MKIAIVSPTAEPAVTSARALGGAGHEVTVHVRRTDPAAATDVEVAPGVTVAQVDAGPPRPLSDADLASCLPVLGAGLARRWAAERPDVAHTHAWTTGLAGAIARRETGVPVVHSPELAARRGGGDGVPRQPSRLETALVRDADHLLARSEAELAEIVRMGAPRRRVCVVPCGVDLSVFTDEGDAWPRTSRPRLLVVGPLAGGSGVDTAVRALRGLPGAELVVAGGPPMARLAEDPDATRVCALAAGLGVLDRLVLLGDVTGPDVPRLLRSGDVVVHVPEEDPCGSVPLAAMACRRPVVASAVGASLDIVADGVTGRLLPPGEPQQLAAVVRTLLATPFELEALGQAGIDRARSRYAWGRVATELAAVYARVAEGAAARTALRR